MNAASFLLTAVESILTILEVPAMPLDHWAQQGPWNVHCYLPMEDWLEESRDKESECRIRTLGNVVVPCQAALAMSALSRMADSDSV